MLSVANKPIMLSVVLLSVTNKPIMLSVVMLNVVMLSGVATYVWSKSFRSFLFLSVHRVKLFSLESLIYMRDFRGKIRIRPAPF
jgi:hypothetical protein